MFKKETEVFPQQKAGINTALQGILARSNSGVKQIEF